MPKFSVTNLKGQTLSDDGNEVVLTFATKYIGDMDVTMPLSCVDELVAALHRTKPDALQGMRETAPATQGNGTAPDAPKAAAASPPPQDGTVPGAPAVPGQLRVTMPKTWLVTADVKTHGVVLLVFNHQEETRVGYALNGVAAKEMATGLVKNAEVVLAHKQAKDEAAKQGGRLNS
jgi:hypothetical protein